MKKTTAAAILVSLAILGVPAASAEGPELNLSTATHCETGTIDVAPTVRGLDRHELARTARARANRTGGVHPVDWVDDADFLRFLWLA